MRARSVDTDPESEKVQIGLLRVAGAGRRAHMALALSGQVIGLARRAIARTDPSATEIEVRLRFVELHYGRELSADLRRHLARRP
jgi:hypothetical protein